MRETGWERGNIGDIVESFASITLQIDVKRLSELKTLWQWTEVDATIATEDCINIAYRLLV